MKTKEEQNIIDVKEEITLQEELMPTLNGIIREEIKEDDEESSK